MFTRLNLVGLTYVQTSEIATRLGDGSIGLLLKPDVRQPSPRVFHPLETMNAFVGDGSPTFEVAWIRSTALAKKI